MWKFLSDGFKLGLLLGKLMRDAWRLRALSLRIHALNGSLARLSEPNRRQSPGAW